MKFTASYLNRLPIIYYRKYNWTSLIWTSLLSRIFHNHFSLLYLITRVTVVSEKLLSLGDNESYYPGVQSYVPVT